MSKSDVMQEYVDNLGYLCPYCSGNGYFEHSEELKTFWQKLIRSNDYYGMLWKKTPCESCDETGFISQDGMNYYISTWPIGMQTRMDVFWAKNPRFTMKLRDV